MQSFHHLQHRGEGHCIGRTRQNQQVTTFSYSFEFVRVGSSRRVYYDVLVISGKANSLLFIHHFERERTPRSPIQSTAVEVAVYQKRGRFGLQVSRQVQCCSCLSDSALE